MNNLKAFIYFVEPEVIEGLLPCWPTEMRLALCLYKTGRVEIMMFHCKEGQSIIKRMRDVLKLEENSFGIVPETRGYPTKAIRFSDQQHFLNLIMEIEDLCEIASDYAINYRFAEEEGLDPIYFTNSSYKGKRPEKNPAVKANQVADPFHSRRAKPARTPKKRKKAQKVTNFISGGKSEFIGNFAEIARIEKCGEHVRLTLNPDAATSDMPVLQAPGIIHIEEYNQFLLERHLLRRWKAGQSAVVEMPVDQLFSKFPSDYFDKPRVAVVMIVPKDIYVTCGPQIPSEEMDIDSFHPAEYSTSLQDSGSVFSVGSQKWQ
jgi:hypothetical protein